MILLCQQCLRKKKPNEVNLPACFTFSLCVRNTNKFLFLIFWGDFPLAVCMRLLFGALGQFDPIQILTEPSSNANKSATNMIHSTASY